MITNNLKIGLGFDIHKLEYGKKLVLGGINIDYEKGFVAHSDGDVLIHALIDAILGALALGDIGTFFPDHEPQFKDIDSKILLKKILTILKNENYNIINIDSTIKAQLPKLSPYILPIRKKLSNILNIDLTQISVKAKTMEYLDSIGETKAISCDVIVLLQKQ